MVERWGWGGAAIIRNHYGSDLESQLNRIHLSFSQKGSSIATALVQYNVNWAPRRDYGYLAMCLRRRVGLCSSIWSTNPSENTEFINQK